MLETKPQQRYFATVIVLIIILGLVSFWGNSGFKYVDNNDYTKPDLSLTESKAYLDYLATIKTDPEASKQLFQELLTKEDVRKEVVSALQADKPTLDPKIDEYKIKLSKESGSEELNNYLATTIGQVYAFNNQTAGINQNLLDIDTQDVDQLKKDLNTLTSQVYSVPVPQEALGMQKALLTSLVAYRDLIDKSKEYNAEDYSSGDGVWPVMYNTFSVANEKTKVYRNDLNKLASKYNITQIDISNSYAEAAKAYDSKVAFIPTAHALFGIGDITFSTTIGDIPRIIMDGIKEGIKSSFLQFTGTMLNKLIQQIEQNYMVSNFLYYTDALVSSQYADDYLNKYVAGKSLPDGSVCTWDSDCASNYCKGEIVLETNKEHTQTTTHTEAKCSSLGIDGVKGGTERSQRAGSSGTTNSSFLTALDNKMIKTFVPQFSCGRQPDNINDVLKAKSSSYLGFDPENINPNDPDYYNKLAKVGSFLGSPYGWKLYYQDMAMATQSASQKAAAAELNSPGLKTPRDVSKLSINKSINSILQAESAGFNTLLQMGTSNADSIVSSIIGHLVEGLINNFVFSGVTGQNGAVVGVLKEQTVCMDSFQIAPLVGISNTAIANPGTISANDAKAIACSSTQNIESECTGLIIDYLNKCLSSSTSGGINAQCTSVAGSIYVDTRLQQCTALAGRVNSLGNPIPLPSDCVSLQNLRNRFLK